MSATVQDIRGKVQELLNRAQLDANFRQLLQMNPSGVLCAAGVPNALALEIGDVSEDCTLTCMMTCCITG
jgi:hypothetical protein